MHDSLILSLNLLSALQKERGLALRALPIGSMEAMASFEMQSTMTSIAMEKLEKDISNFSVLMPRRFSEAIQLRNNESFRSSQPVDHLAEWYAFNLEQPVQQFTISLLTENPNFSPAQTSALAHYLAALTSLSQLRDIGIIIYAKAEMSSQDMSRIKSTAASSLARERLFLGLADESIKRILDESRAPTLMALGQVDEILNKTKVGQGKSVLAETPMTLWCEILDTELAARQGALTQMITRLDTEGRELALLNMPGQALDGDIEHSIDHIRSIPLFRGLSESTLRSVLKGARFLDVEKNTPFLTQDEPSSRLYLLIDGWAKVYKTTEEGEEAVLQILGRRECVLDNTLLNPGVSTISAKTVTKARLLVLSLSTLRDNISRNRELAQNFLSITSQRHQKLVAQFEQITLRSAVDRVGWFLVNLHLETGLEGAPLELPYDKALIASYLNIKPETFSRVLQQFRKKGFKIDKHQVVMPNPQSLCEYCDPDMSLRCCRAEAYNCAPIQAARRAIKK